MWPVTKPSAMRMVPWMSDSGDGRLGLSGRTGDEEAGRDGHAAPGQPVAQPLARPGQPAPDRDLREPELMRRRGVGQPLEVAEHDRRPQPLGQAVDLLVERGRVGIVLSGGSLSEVRSATSWSSLRRRAALRRARVRDAMRDPEEPARDRPAPADRAGPAGQHEEGGLEGVLRIVGVMKDAPADPQHHRAVPGHQLLEGRLRGLIAPRGEPLQELRIGHRPGRAEVEQPMEGFPAIVPDLLGDWSLPSSTRPAGDPHEVFSSRANFVTPGTTPIAERS